MFKFVTHITTFYLVIFSSFTFAAVDETSPAYNAGSIAGKVFLVVIIALIAKKIFFSKK